jgi:hypothetical protein
MVNELKQTCKKKTINNNELLKELILRQLKNVSHDKKLQYTDLKRICKYINSSIFNETNCCDWNGYVTNANNTNKGTYVNFYFRKKKAALHRLLYCNFVGDLSEDEYLKFSCENKGKCCNVKHLRKFKYVVKDDPHIINNNNTTNKNKNTHEHGNTNKQIKISTDAKKLFISFD